jgi:hypothetical protein
MGEELSAGIDSVASPKLASNTRRPVVWIQGITPCTPPSVTRTRNVIALPLSGTTLTPPLTSARSSMTIAVSVICRASNIHVLWPTFNGCLASPR